MIKIDLENESIEIEESQSYRTVEFKSPEAFQILSDLWIRLGWDHKYVYSFSWLGRPIIQLPEDMIRIQELIYQVKPNIIIETGVAHGGSLIYYAGILENMRIKYPKVWGIDIEIREHNREAIEKHALFEYIELIESTSISPKTIEKLKNEIKAEDKVLVILDSNHSKEHVLKELELYSQFVTIDSYIIATDGIMKDLKGAPRSNSDWEWNNPYTALKTFVKQNKAFKIEEPVFPFNEGDIDFRVTYWPSAYLKRVKHG